MSLRTRLLLDILQEECSEVIKTASKAKRFGLDSTPDSLGESLPNRDYIVHEFIDAQVTFELLQELGALPTYSEEKMAQMRAARREKTEKYLRISMSLPNPLHE